MDKNPIVTIITPSYNQAQFIEATILSALNQDYDHIEYIIIDGLSTDNTVDIIRKYEDKIAYWKSEPDRGQADALMKGFDLASGDVMGWLNSDDIYLGENVVSQVVAHFKDQEQIGAVAGGGMIIDANGKPLRRLSPPRERVNYEQLRYRNWLFQPATFFRREVMRALPLDRELHFVFDWDFFIRLVDRYPIFIVDSVWAGSRMWGQNKTGRGDPERIRELADVTGRYVGKDSWQYKALQSLFRMSQQGNSSLPDYAQTAVSMLLFNISRALNLISDKRFPLLT
jgi:glycosyltransferase involved in cell wall biosynthesis